MFLELPAGQVPSLPRACGQRALQDRAGQRGGCSCELSLPVALTRPACGGERCRAISVRVTVHYRGADVRHFSAVARGALWLSRDLEAGRALQMRPISFHSCLVTGWPAGSPAVPRGDFCKRFMFPHTEAEQSPESPRGAFGPRVGSEELPSRALGLCCAERSWLVAGRWSACRRRIWPAKGQLQSW